MAEGGEFPAEETAGAKALRWRCLISSKNTSEVSLGRVNRGVGRDEPREEGAGRL